MNYNIRKACINDLNEIYDMQSKYNHDLISKNSLEDDLKAISSIYFVALDDDNGSIIGAIGGTCLVDHIDISIVITKKEFSNKGIATSLLNTLIKYAKENGISKIFLEVRNSNTPAINLYKKIGFEQISIRRKYYSDDSEDALIFLLEID